MLAERMLPLFVFAALFAAGVVIPAIVVLIKRAFQARQEMILQTIAAAVRAGAPLAPALRAFASGGMFNGAAVRAAESLETGAPPHVALSHGWLLAPDAKLLLAAGSESGDLRLSINDALDIRSVPDPWRARINYLFWLLVYLVFIIGYSMVYVVPNMISIFDDFNTPLPTASLVLIGIAVHVANYYVPLLGVLALAMLLYVMCACLGYVFGYSLPRFPVRWLRWRLDTALLLRATGVMMSGGKNVPDIFIFLAERFPAPGFRKRLRKASVDVEAGGDWREALLKRRLIRRTDASVLAAAERVGNTPWALGEVAAAAERRFWLRRQFFWRIAFPIALVVLGCLVALVAMNVFLPITSLINSLA